MSLDSCLVELRHIRAEIAGISPKLSIYHKLKAREKELMAQIGEKPLQEIHNKRDAGLTKLHKLRCPMQDCPNLRKEHGIDSHGFLKRDAMCPFHLKMREKKLADENRISQLNGKA